MWRVLFVWRGKKWWKLSDCDNIWMLRRLGVITITPMVLNSLGTSDWPGIHILKTVNLLLTQTLRRRGSGIHIIERIKPILKCSLGRDSNTGDNGIYFQTLSGLNRCYFIPIPQVRKLTVGRKSISVGGGVWKQGWYISQKYSSGKQNQWGNHIDIDYICKEKKEMLGIEVWDCGDGKSEISRTD